jgi:hypothetical protein
VSPTVQILVAIIQAVGAAAGPLLERMFAKVAAGQDPLDALAQENLADILGAESALQVEEQIARARLAGSAVGQ